VIVREFVWSPDRVEHIARHEVTPEEVEQVCFGRSLVLGTKASGKNPVYHVLGQTDAGRYLFCVVIQFPGEKGYVVTARAMTDKEKRRFQEWAKR
jgi:uncharacterized DUF497 family protein